MHYAAPMLSELTWRTLTPAELPAIAELAARCLRADGGLPLVAAESFLAGRYAAPEGATRGAFTPEGRLVAVGAVRPQHVGGIRRVLYCGLVDPDHRGRRVGGALLDWGLAEAAAGGGGVFVETETLTRDATALFTARGLTQVFAEEVMRFDLAAGPLPPVCLPVGSTLHTWSDALVPRFFAVYADSFRDRPGFPDWPQQQWVDWTTDDTFRPDWSLLATDARGVDAAFITCAQGWIVQVGVRPGWRGRGFGAGLVAEALRRMAAVGTSEVLLDVNVENPAGALYARLGFAPVGRRARFAPTP